MPLPTPYFEHLAVNVPDSAALADWYVANLNLRIIRSGPGPLHGRFLADATGRVILETYQNPDAPIPDYQNLNPLTLHLAFVVDNVPATIERLTAANATLAQDPFTTPEGDQIAMLRDPWGLPLQLITRATPLA